MKQLIQRRYQKLCGSVSALLILITAVSVTDAFTAPASPRREVNEPEVTKNEESILREAADKAADSPAAAISFLKKNTGPKASPALDFAMASYAVQNNKPGLAEPALRSALGKMPDFYRARLFLAQVLLREQQPEEAATELQKLINTNYPDRVRLWNLLSTAYAPASKHTAAETAARQALLRDPDNREAKLGIVRALAAQDRIEDAGALIRELLETNPLQGQLWQAVAQARLKRKDNLEALIMLECARRLDLAGTDTMATLGDLYLQQGIPQAAVQVYQQLATLEDAPADRILKAIEALIQMQRLTEAKTLLQSLETGNEKLSTKQQDKHLLLKARLYLKEEQTRKAIEAYTRLLRQKPLQEEALLNLGQVYLQENELQKAENLFKRATRLKNIRARALLGLARVKIARKQYKKAVSLLQDSLEAEKDPRVERFLEQLQKLLRRTEA
ncbi:MAG: tetratricopeptide repeat protein [Lentisphaeria bacterium]